MVSCFCILEDGILLLHLLKYLALTRNRIKLLELKLALHFLLVLTREHGVARRLRADLDKVYL